MNALQQILEHDAASPWTFLNGSFWLFLLVVLALDAALHRDRQRGLRHFWLLLASLLFYWKTSGWFFLILVFSSFSSLVHFCESLASCLVVSMATALVVLAPEASRAFATALWSPESTERAAPL